MMRKALLMNKVKLPKAKSTDTNLAKTIKKTVKKIFANVKVTNATFNKLSPAQKRVYIAKDVIAQLDSKRLVPECGTYLSGIDSKGKAGALFNFVENGDVQVQSLLKEKTQCIGCALGGLFLSAVDAANDLKVEKLWDYDCDDTESYVGRITESDSFDYLSRFFSIKQINMIEHAFERWVGGNAKFNYLEASGDFAFHVDDPGDRMRLIMENIIKNKGTFMLGKK